MGARLGIAVVFALAAGCGDPRLVARPTVLLEALPARTDQVVLAVRGAAPAGAQVVVEGGAAPAQTVADAAGTFAVGVSLQIGVVNRLRILAESPGAPPGVAEARVEQVPVDLRPAPDLTPPQPPVLAAPPAVVWQTWLTIRGSAEPGATAEVRDPYQVQTVATDPASGEFAAVVRLRRADVSEIVVTARDGAGNESAAASVSTRHELRETPLPDGTLAAPRLEPFPPETAATRLTLHGETAPHALVRVEGGEAPGQAVADGEGRFAVGVALRLGADQELRVVAFDEQGHGSLPTVLQVAQRGARGGTRYPLVFAHGLGGSAEILGFIPYWNRIQEALEADGHEVLIADVTPLHSTTHRAAQLRDQIDRFTSGKVNLIGHSMGGIDARYLVSGLGFGGRVSSVTSIGAPHRGTSLGDLALGAVGRDAFVAADLLFRHLGMSLAAVEELSVAGMERFNLRFPDDRRVAYFSWAGRADPLGVTGNVLSPLFVAPWTVLRVHEGDNDGLVSVESAHWGDYQGTLTADHLDEIGQLVGVVDHFDHVAFYRQLARDLQARGH